MYDPARDSWNGEKEETQESKPSQPKSPQEEEQQPSSKALEPVNEESANTVKEDKEPLENPLEISDPLEEKAQENKLSSPKETEVPSKTEEEPKLTNKKRPLTSNEDNYEPKNQEAEKNTAPESRDHFDQKQEENFNERSSSSHSESKPQSSSTQESNPAKSPPRKRRLPNSRVSNEDRAKKTQQLRDRIERNERQNDGDHYNNNIRPRNDVEMVRSHYNQRPDQGHEGRQRSPIIKLRSFNNWVKATLISMYCDRGYTVLDLGCGKGGDLTKWWKNRVSGYIGIDIADVSVKQARDRYDNSKAFRFWADFCVGDPFSQRVDKIVAPGAFPVDIVSCQFCLHYSFESEDRARKLLENVSFALKSGHYFIGTIPNSDVFVKNIRRLGTETRRWGNKFYSVEFVTDPPKDGIFDPPFGHKYNFFLEDAVGDVPEYVVPFEALIELAKDYGLELAYRKPFLKVFEQFANDEMAMSTARRMKVLKDDGSPGIEGDEREIAAFYLAFAFRKI